MADTKRDDPDASIAREEEEESHSHHGLDHEMSVLSSVVAREHLSDHGDERHEFPRASTPQDKGPCDDGGAPRWNDLTHHRHVVAPRDPDREGTRPGTRQGLPSFAQSEFYTVYLIFFIFSAVVDVLIFTYFI